MDHLADSTAKLSQSRENWYIDREGVPVDGRFWEKCEPVIVFECMDLSIGQGVNVSGLSCVSNNVLRCCNSYKVICDLNWRLLDQRHIDSRLLMMYKAYTSSKVYCLCGVGLRGANLGPST